MAKNYSTNFLLVALSMSIFVSAISLLLQDPNFEKKLDHDKFNSYSLLNYIFPLEKFSVVGYKYLIAGIAFLHYMIIVGYLRLCIWVREKTEVIKVTFKFFSTWLIPLFSVIASNYVKECNGVWVLGLVIVSLSLLIMVFDIEDDGGLRRLFYVNALAVIALHSRDLYYCFGFIGFAGLGYGVEFCYKEFVRHYVSVPSQKESKSSF